MEKVAVITGGEGRIGRGIARQLANDGFIVVLSYLSGASETKELVAEILRTGGSARAIEVDVADQFWMRLFFEEIVDAFGRIDVVVHNDPPQSHPLFDESGAEDEVMSTNLQTTFLVLDQAGSHVVDGGRIIVVSSSAPSRPDEGYAWRGTSEERLEVYLYRLANDLHERNVSVNVIACGRERNGCAPENSTTDRRIDGNTPVHSERVEEPTDIAGVVSFLAGPDGHLVASQVLCAS